MTKGNDNLLLARRHAGLSQEELAAAVGITRQMLSAIEVHGWLPPDELRAKLAIAVGVPETEIFDVAHK